MRSPVRTLPPVALVVALALVAAGCATPPPVPDDHFYRLAPSGITAGADPVLDGRLWIAPFRAEGVRRGRKMLYSSDPGQLRFKEYHYHYWESDIPTLLRRRFQAILETAGIAGESSLRPTPPVAWRLESRVIRFERLTAGGPYRVVVALEFELAPGDQPHQVGFHRRYEVEQVADSATMEASVVAYTRAIDEIAQRFLADLRAAER